MKRQAKNIELLLNWIPRRNYLKTEHKREGICTTIINTVAGKEYFQVARFDSLILHIQVVGILLKKASVFCRWRQGHMHKFVQILFSVYGYR